MTKAKVKNEIARIETQRVPGRSTDSCPPLGIGKVIVGVCRRCTSSGVSLLAITASSEAKVIYTKAYTIIPNSGASVILTT